MSRRVGSLDAVMLRSCLTEHETKSDIEGAHPVALPTKVNEPDLVVSRVGGSLK